MRPRRPANLPLILAACAVLAAGCDPGVGPPGPAIARKPRVVVGHADDPKNLPPGAVLAPDRDADAPDRVDRTPRASDDPREIAEVRRLAAAEADEGLARGLEALHGEPFYVTDHLCALRARGDQALAELRRILADASAPPKARARAADLLIWLGRRDEGERFLFEALKSGPTPLRLAALEVIGGVHSPDLSDPARARLLLDQVDDPDPAIAEEAARITSWRDVAGAEAKLLALLRSGRSRDPRRLAENLARVAETPEGAAAALRDLLRERPARYDWGIGYSLEHLLDSPDPKLSGPARDAFRAFLLGYEGEERLDQSFARDFSRAADRATIPVLEEILAQSKDRMSRLYAVEGLARLDPARAVDQLLDFARREGRPELVVEALGRYATEADAERIIPVLLGDGRPGSPRADDERTARFFYEKLGPRGREALAKATDRLDPDARMWLLWRTKGLDLGAALDDLHAAGVIAEDRGAILDRMRRDREESRRRGYSDDAGPLDLSDPDNFKVALGAAHLTTMFDAETDELPCNHHLLLAEEFAHGSGCPRRFAPECAVQAWLRKNEDDLDAPYLVRFILGGRLYRFGAENRGDWYDVEAVQRAANFALETSGRKERFLTLETGGQDAAFVFADPAPFVPIATKYGLPLSDDPDGAMRQGKEFERRVIEELKK